MDRWTRKRNPPHRRVRSEYLAVLRMEALPREVDMAEETASAAIEPIRRSEDALPVT